MSADNRPDNRPNFRLIVVGIAVAVVAIFVIQSVLSFRAEQSELGDIADRAACEYTDDC